MANLITLTRVLMLFVAVALLYTRNVRWTVVSLILVVVVILMDWLDGVVARAQNQATPVGAMMDILGDRIVENTLWIVFAHLHLIPVWVPIVVMIRGFVTDSLRGVALTRGQTPFGEKTMVRGVVGRLLVSSRLSRALYAGAKVGAFTWMIFYLAYQQVSPAYQAPWLPVDRAYAIGLFLVYMTVAFCLIRAVPVVISGVALLRAQE